MISGEQLVISIGAKGSGEIRGSSEDEPESWVPQVPILGPGIPQISKKTQASFASLGHPHSCRWIARVTTPPLSSRPERSEAERLWFPISGAKSAPDMGHP